MAAPKAYEGWHGGWDRAEERGYSYEADEHYGRCYAQGTPPEGNYRGAGAYGTWDSHGGGQGGRGRSDGPALPDYHSGQGSSGAKGSEPTGSLPRARDGTYNGPRLGDAAPRGGMDMQHRYGGSEHWKGHHDAKGGYAYTEAKGKGYAYTEAKGKGRNEGSHFQHLEGPGSAFHEGTGHHMGKGKGSGYTWDEGSGMGAPGKGDWDGRGQDAHWSWRGYYNDDEARILAGRWAQDSRWPGTSSRDW